MRVFGPPHPHPQPWFSQVSFDRGCVVSFQGQDPKAPFTDTQAPETSSNEEIRAGPLFHRVGSPVLGTPEAATWAPTGGQEGGPDTQRVGSHS